MVKLEQKAKKGLYGGFKPGSTGGLGTGKLKKKIEIVSTKVKRGVGNIASNIKDKIETRKTEKATEELANMGSSKNPRFLQDVSNAYLSGGTRPMTLGSTIQPGDTNAPSMGNFGGAMNMSGVPNVPIDPVTGLPMNYGMMAQTKGQINAFGPDSELAKEDPAKAAKLFKGMQS